LHDRQHLRATDRLGEMFVEASRERALTIARARAAADGNQSRNAVGALGS